MVIPVDNEAHPFCLAREVTSHVAATPPADTVCDLLGFESECPIWLMDMCHGNKRVPIWLKYLPEPSDVPCHASPP
jgi:hypothetical protein